MARKAKPETEKALPLVTIKVDIETDAKLRNYRTTLNVERRKAGLPAARMSHIVKQLVDRCLPDFEYTDQ